MFNYRKYIKDGTQIYSYNNGLIYQIDKDGRIYDFNKGLVARIEDNGQIYSFNGGIIAKIEDNGQIYSYNDGIVAKIEENGQIYSYKDGLVAVIQNLAFGFDGNNDGTANPPLPTRSSDDTNRGLGFWLFLVLIFIFIVSRGIEPVFVFGGVIFLIFSFFHYYDPDTGLWDQLEAPVKLFGGIAGAVLALYLVGVVWDFIRGLRYIKPVYNLLAIISVTCLLAVILGLIKPDLVVWWGDKEIRNRKTVLKYYLTGMLVSFIIMIL